MARTVSLNITLTGIDTANVSGNDNIVEYAELIENGIPSTLLDSFNIEIPANTSATSIKSQAATLAGVSNVAYVLLMTYNIAESTPKVQVVVDSAATVAGRHAAGIYTSTITIATTSLSNPVTVQAFFYKAY